MASVRPQTANDAFKTFMQERTDRLRRKRASKLASQDQGLWTDRDIDLLLSELEIEVGEGANRFVFEDERSLYCLFLSEVILFEIAKTSEQIYEMIIWLWSTWEAISKATGKSWWNITKKDKYQLSLLSNNKDQRLKSKFKYFDKCDRIFAYIREEEGEEDNCYGMKETIYY